MSNQICSRCNRRINEKKTFSEYFRLLFDKGEEPVIKFSSVDEQMPVALEAAFNWFDQAATKDIGNAKFIVINTPSEASAIIDKYKGILLLFIKKYTAKDIHGSEKACEESGWNVNYDESTFFYRNINVNGKPEITITAWQSGEGEFSFNFKRGQSPAYNLVAC